MEIYTSVEFFKINYEKCIEFLESGLLNVMSEEEVFFAAMNWVNSGPEKRIQYIPDLLKIIRLPLLSPAVEYLFIPKYETRFVFYINITLFNVF